MPLTDDGLIKQLTHPSGIGGVQRIYRFGEWGLSLVNSPMLHHFPFAWEAAVIKFKNDGHDDFDLNYSTSLTCDVEIFRTDEEANEFIEKAKVEFEAMACDSRPQG